MNKIRAKLIKINNIAKKNYKIKQSPKMRMKMKIKII